MPAMDQLHGYAVQYGVLVQSQVKTMPLFTGLMLAAMVGLWVLGLFTGITELFWLQPSELLKFQMHRMNTYPLVHLGILHLLLNMFPLVPLLSHFERQNGTLVTASIFFGMFEIIPTVFYVVTEYFMLGNDWAVAGSSGWVFTLLAIEAVQNAAIRPQITGYGFSIPTQSTPFLILIVTWIIIPSSSFLGHVGGLLVGYLFAYGLLGWSIPKAWILKWIETKGEKFGILQRLPNYVKSDEATASPFTLPSYHPSPASSSASNSDQQGRPGHTIVNGVIGNMAEAQASSGSLSVAGETRPRASSRATSSFQGQGYRLVAENEQL
ncbi:hypothetical protein SAICODRAFT_4604 [Saitoella complicata NRRL Y-17804]|nr:uncharacterized protein SAICODRAFT_4604 [Saitoella complicata NRRL Y-17804]ODQ56424.1 hypothetical protein SAICODRAFT_4604 [Saitoella complicata NRRL Y-17804]